MKICIPTEDNRGLDSRISGHVGRAPYHCIVDTVSESIEMRANGGQHREHDAVGTSSSCNDHSRSQHSPAGGRTAPQHMCDAGERIRTYGVDAVLCSRIGSRARAALEEGGIAVFTVWGSTVGAALREAQSGQLRPLTNEICPGRHDGR